jgi:hypothetical protein
LKSLFGFCALRGVALAAQNGAAFFWLKRYVIVLAAIVTDYLKPRSAIGCYGALSRPAFCTALRRRHVPAIKIFLIFLAEQKQFFALYAGQFRIRHKTYSLRNQGLKRQVKVYLRIP